MKNYHVATGDGKAYYGVNYESYREAEAVLKFSQRRDPQAHIVEEEYHFTNADHIRAMSDEALAEKLYDIWRGEVERGNDLATNWCHSDCGSSEDCDPEKHKACILRWLRQPAKET